jgi:uncharacterized membrane protein YccC
MYILALVCASIVGYGYGLALLYQQEQAHAHTRYAIISSIRMASVCCLAFVGSRMLHLSQIDFILLSIGFMCTFWYACTQKIGVFNAKQ